METPRHSRPANSKNPRGPLPVPTQGTNVRASDSPAKPGPHGTLPATVPAGAARGAPSAFTNPAPTPPRPPRLITGGVEIAPGLRVLADVISFSFARASGPGGQNVNKVATKAILRIRLTDLPVPADALARLRAAAGHRLVGELPNDELLFSSDKSRSQEANKDQTLDDLRQLLVAALKRPKTRRVTKPSRGAKMRRLDSKKRRSATKQQRRGSDD